MTKVWSKDEIRKNLLNDDRWVERGVLAIFERQTTEEQNIGETVIANGVGYSGAHASVMSYYANWLSAGRHLTGKHLEKARKFIVHYTGQLTRIANGEL